MKEASETLRPAVFLDRDGTIIEDVPYLREPDRICLYPRVRESIDALRRAGFLIVLITNQSGIGRGLLTEAEFHLVQTELSRLLGGGGFDGVYFCPDVPAIPSARRKPAPGMLFEAERDLHLDLPRSWFIGDKESDVECAIRAGVSPIQVKTGEGAAHPHPGARLHAASFEEAADHILHAAALLSGGRA